MINGQELKEYVESLLNGECDFCGEHCLDCICDNGNLNQGLRMKLGKKDKAKMIQECTQISREMTSIEYNINSYLNIIETYNDPLLPQNQKVNAVQATALEDHIDGAVEAYVKLEIRYENLRESIRK